MIEAGAWPTGLRHFLESEDNASDGVVRNALLVGSQNVWLREHIATLPFVRRAVNRFMIVPITEPGGMLFTVMP